MMLHMTVKNHMTQLQITVTNNIVEGSRTIITLIQDSAFDFTL